MGGRQRSRLARRVRPHTTGGERRCLGDPLPRLAQSALLVPECGTFRSLGAEGAFHYLGTPACVVTARPPQAAHRESPGFHPGGIPPHIQFEHHRTEYPPHRRVGRPVRTLQRRHVSYARLPAGGFFSPGCALRHGTPERRTTFVGRAYHLQRPGADQPPAR